jgi:hypothetical protein
MARPTLAAFAASVDIGAEAFETLARIGDTWVLERSTRAGRAALAC